MAKKSPPQPRKPGMPAPAPARGKDRFALNPDLHRQTRKLLAKHYRQKFGVK